MLQGNHGEDVKELYYYLDNTPSHSYMKALYKYPQAEFPYAQLEQENARRSVNDPEFEILDTGVFKEGRYFDVTAEYCKAGPNDILGRYTVANRGPERATVHVLPQLWYRNVWDWGEECEVRIVFICTNGSKLFSEQLFRLAFDPGVIHVLCFG